MKQQDLIAMVYDFVGLLITRVPPRKIRSIILFGSVARNDYDTSSDIDLFIDTSSEIKGEITKVMQSFEVVKKRVWSLKGKPPSLNVITGDLEKPHWSSLREEIQNYGILLFGSCKPLSKTNPHVLISYELGSLSQSNKVRLLRKLYGYSIKKDGKVYPQKGLLEIERGSRIGSNVFLIPSASNKILEDFLKKIKVSYQARPIFF